MSFRSGTPLKGRDTRSPTPDAQAQKCSRFYHVRRQSAEYHRDHAGCREVAVALDNGQANPMQSIAVQRGVDLCQHPINDRLIAPLVHVEQRRAVRTNFDTVVLEAADRRCAVKCNYTIERFTCCRLADLRAGNSAALPQQRRRRVQWRGGLQRNQAERLARHEDCITRARRFCPFQTVAAAKFGDRS